MSTSLIYNKSKTDNHSTRLAELILSHDKILLCSGWLNYQALDILLPTIKAALSQEAKIHLIYSEKNIRAHKGINDRLKKMEEASTSNGSFSYYMVPTNERFVHSKAYLFEKGSSYTLIVGSANLMHTGLQTYDELSVEHSGKVGDGMHLAITNYLNRIVPA